MPSKPTHRQQAGISERAEQLARAIDRACRQPGRYTITLTLPDHPNGPWQADISREEPLQRLQLSNRLTPPEQPC